MKKFTSILLCCLMVLSLASCMSKEEKLQAKNNEKEAKSIIQEYLDENYDGADIKELECLTITNTSLFVTTSATDYVKAKVKYDNKTFYVLVNLESGKFYTDYYVDKIQDEIGNLVCDTTSVEKPRDMEFRVMLKEFDDIVDECWGFLEEDIDSAKELLESGDYQTYALFKYVKSDENFRSIPIKSVFKDEYKSELHITFANYRSSSHYVDEQLKGYRRISSLPSLYNDEYGYYNISHLKSASRKNSSNIEEEYRHYKSKVYNDVEFIWNDECFNIDFSKATAKDTIVSDNYGDTKFYAISEDAIKLDCKYDYNVYTLSSDTKVCMYLPEDMEDYFVAFDDEYGTVAEKLKTNGKKYAYQSKTLDAYDQEFTIGFYKIADSE